MSTAPLIAFVDGKYRLTEIRSDSENLNLPCSLTLPLNRHIRDSFCYPIPVLLQRTALVFPRLCLRLSSILTDNRSSPDLARRPTSVFDSQRPP